MRHRRLPRERRQPLGEFWGQKSLPPPWLHGGKCLRGCLVRIETTKASKLPPALLARTDGSRRSPDCEGSARLIGPRLVGAEILDLLGRLVFQLAGLVSGLATQIGSLLLGPHVDGFLGRLEFGSRFQSLSG